jgi:hypothetical protein
VATLVVSALIEATKHKSHGLLSRLLWTSGNAVGTVTFRGVDGTALLDGKDSTDMKMMLMIQ